MRIIPALVIGGAVLYIATKAAKAVNLTSLNFDIKTVKPGWQGISPILDITVTAQNPTNNDYTMASLVGDVYVNGKYVGNLSNFDIVNVKATSATPITMRVKLSAAEIANQVFAIINGDQAIAALVEVQGKVNVDKILYPISMKANLV